MAYHEKSANSGNLDLFLFQKKAPDAHLIANIDGGARGNPGPAGYGVVIKDQAGNKVAALSQYLGHQTNNYAEYSGLLAALQYALEHGPKALKVISDSELLVRQIRGQYKVKNPALQELHGRAKQLMAKLNWFAIDHSLREQNREADRLANQAMDSGMGRRNTASIPTPAAAQEFEGVVRNGRIEILSGELPEGTRVQVRIKK